MTYNKLHVKENDIIKYYIVSNVNTNTEKLGINVIKVTHQILGDNFIKCNKYIPTFRVVCIEPITLNSAELDNPNNLK